MKLGDGSLASKALLNGTTTTYGRDNASQLTSVNHTGPGGAPLKRRDYLYNLVGNRTAMQHDGGLWDVYGHDAVDQLTSAKYGAATSGGANPALRYFEWVGEDRMLRSRLPAIQ